jgi:hypothetical protein
MTNRNALDIESTPAEQAGGAIEHARFIFN